MHYGGVACEMDAIVKIADRHRLLVIEDAAHALGATYGGRQLGSIGQLGAISFHETKNLTSGEGGALLLGDPQLAKRAEVLHEKGTNRREFLRGAAPWYEWVGVGSSFGLSEINAAFLQAQLDQADAVCAMRVATWHRYHERLRPLADTGRLRLPTVPRHCRHRGHLYYVLARDRADRDRLLAGLRDRGVDAVFHYVALHSSPAGRRFGRARGNLDTTEQAAATLLRLPIWAGMEEADVEHVIDALFDVAR
jgi:dTDP-4-amino-4,6-dideoxygalactose transaminase